MLGTQCLPPREVNIRQVGGGHGSERKPTFCFGLPITAGKTDLGQSSPAIPALQRPEPLSMTTAGFVTWTDILGSVRKVQEGSKQNNRRQARKSGNERNRMWSVTREKSVRNRKGESVRPIDFLAKWLRYGVGRE